ncbi:MAG: FAD:protein FMN transferase [Acidobacteriota bacterium]|nr:FAD:protein FMN transferase [Acidobacteriota bacterium]
MQIRVYAHDGAEADHAIRAAFRRIAALDEILSDYKIESELSRVTRIAVQRPVGVSDELFRVLAAAQALSEKSKGAFDITLGPLTRLWRTARKAGQLPDSSDLQDAAARCGYRKMHLHAAAKAVSFDQPGMLLDAGGIAKGFAADEALRVLTELGIHSALVAAGGDLAFSDAPTGERGWKIAIASEPGKTITLTNAAVSTSGDTEQHLDVDGVRYSHIIDPNTGIALTNRNCITVVARHGIDADGMTKVFSVQGHKTGLIFVDSIALGL